MRDYWMTQYILAGVGLGYLAVAAAALALAVWIPRSTRMKAGAFLVVLILASILPVQGISQYLDQRKAAEEQAARYQTAKALFQERCKTAGERVYRTIDKVEGIALERLRPTEFNLSNQFTLDDPYGQVSGRGQDYLETFLGGRRNQFQLTDEHTLGAYRYVDLLNSEGGATRFTMVFDIDQAGRRRRLIAKQEVSLPAPFVVRWKDTSTPQDRTYWIACGSVEVIDRRSGERLGERNGCMFDRGLGSTEGGRSPWAFARELSCPEPRRTPDGRAYFDRQDRNFAEKVLKPVAEAAR